MKKEYRGKFGNFVHEERKKEEETLEICEDILKNSRNEMAVAMRFLQSAFGALRPTVSVETDVMGTDGKMLYASPTSCAANPISALPMPRHRRKTRPRQTAR